MKFSKMVIKQSLESVTREANSRVKICFDSFHSKMPCEFYRLNLSNLSLDC